MTRFIAQLVLATALLATGALLFAAGDVEMSAASSDQLEGVDPTGAVVDWWHQHSGQRQEGLIPMVDEFNATNEWGITVNQEYAGGYGDIYNKMITAIAGGELPDLVVAYQNQASGYQVANALVDLTPYVEHPEWGIDDPSDFFSGFYNQDVNMQFGGQRLGFPPNRSIEIMYYNKTWLEELGFANPPATWDEFRAVAMAATDPEAGTIGYEVRTDASNVYAMIIGRGGEIAKEDGSGYTFNTPEMRESMQFMKDLYDDGYATKIPGPYADQGDFGNQIVPMTMGSSSGLPYYQSAVDAGERGTFEWTVAPIPHTTRRAQTNVYGASVSVPRTTPETQLAAWLFTRWFAEPEQQAQWVRISNYFPVRYSVAENLDDYFDANPRFEDAFSILETTVTRAEPPYAGYDEVRDLVAAAFNAILDGAPIDATIADLEMDANDVHEIASP